MTKVKSTGHDARLAELAMRQRIAEAGGGKQAADAMSARERVLFLLDEGSFEETDKLVIHRATDFVLDSQRVPGDGVITGYGRIAGRVVFVFAQDSSVFGGSLSEANAAKIVKLMEMAVRVGAPIIGLHDSKGIRVQEGVTALAGYGDILLRSTLARGVVPQIAAIFGPCGGDAALLPAMADFTLMTKSSLDGRNAGDAAHFIAHGYAQCLEIMRELLSFVPSSQREDPPRKASENDAAWMDVSLDTFLPEGISQRYDVRDVIGRIVDDAYLLEVQRQFASNLVAGFARMAGRPVGIVANQPVVLDGALDSDACLKGARFVRFCDAFNIPLITFVDVPGFLPGQAEVFSHAAEFAHAFAKATVPKLTVVLRRAYGAAYCIMGSRQLRADVSLAWPTAEVTAMGPEGAVNTIYRRELETALRTAQAVWPQGMAFSEEKKMELLAEAREQKVEEFRERFANPYTAAERGYVDAVIRPSETRRRLNVALDVLAERWKVGLA